MLESFSSNENEIFIGQLSYMQGGNGSLNYVVNRYKIWPDQQFEQNSCPHKFRRIWTFSSPHIIHYPYPTKGYFD